MELMRFVDFFYETKTLVFVSAVFNKRELKTFFEVFDKRESKALKKISSAMELMKLLIFFSWNKNISFCAFYL